MVFLPVAVAWAGPAPPRPFWDELASAAGMMAFSIVLAEFLLSGRFRAISAGVGLDVTIALHQIIARSALVLALLHPFLYQSSFAAPMVWDPHRVHALTTDVSSLFGGIVAWLLLTPLVLLAAARGQTDYSYEQWRLIHGLGAAVIAAGTLHHVLAAGRYADDPLLAWIWVAMTAVALGSLALVYLLRPFRKWRTPWRVEAVVPMGPRQWDLTLAPDGHAGLDYQAGQFVWLNVGHPPFSLNENPFSMASAPAEGARLRFLIKELGDFTNTIGHVEPGTRAYLDGPHGNLTLSGRREPGIALIAGGVGIAPLIGILRALRAQGDPRPTTLIYGNRIVDQIAYGDELTAMTQEHGTRVIHVLSQPPEAWDGEVGLIDAALIARIFAAPECRDWFYLVCGPPAMMSAVEDALSELKVPAAQVLSERFTYD